MCTHFVLKAFVWSAQSILLQLLSIRIFYANFKNARIKQLPQSEENLQVWLSITLKLKDSIGQKLFKDTFS